ncbi:MAG TPA: serine hydrolase domain-containing protein [Stellaceae bacterium]|nr:serine hydrolase domain-containing protein [Stellaceae bacterium]
MPIGRTLSAAIAAGLLSFCVHAEEPAKPAAPLQPAAMPPLSRVAPEEVGMSSARLARIGAALEADIERGRIPGAVVAIARRGKLVYLEAFGWRDKAAGRRMTTDTIFNIASMTKPMTAVGALMLYERGALLIDDPVAKYLPQFAEMRVAVLDAGGDAITGTVPAAKAITIQDLMRHTSGIIYGGRGTTAVHKMYPPTSAAAATSLTGEEFLDTLGGLPLLHQPGKVWDYGFGLDVLGLLIERLSHETLGAYLQHTLFQPLGMVDTGFAIPPEKAQRYAKALPLDPDAGRPQTVGPDATRPLKFDCGGGCAVSTAEDYLRFALLLLQRGAFNGTRLLSRKTVEYMTADQLGPDVVNLIAKADPTRADYGFGLGLAVRRTAGIVRLMGSVGDFSWPGASGTNWWADPQEELAVVFMAHSPGPARWHYRELINALVYQAIAD